MTDSVRVALAPGVGGITLPLALYLAAWVVVATLALWGAWRLLKAREADGTPTLFWYLRLMPKMEMLFAVVIIAWVATIIVATWKLAHGAGMGEHFGEYMLSINGLTATAGGTYALKRATTKPELMQAEDAG